MGTSRIRSGGRGLVVVVVVLVVVMAVAVVVVVFDVGGLLTLAFVGRLERPRAKAPKSPSKLSPTARNEGHGSGRMSR